MTPCACLRLVRLLLAHLRYEFVTAAVERLYTGTEAP